MVIGLGKPSIKKNIFLLTFVNKRVVTLFGSAPGSDDVISLDTRAPYITL